MKHLFTAAAMLFSMAAFAQVGINNTSPKATLDITAKTTDGSKPEGLIIPQLSGSNIHTATAAGVYGSNQKGLIIYATSADSSPISTTANITAAGYYYFDGTNWQKVMTGSVANSDLATGVGGIYKGSGSLSGNTTVTQGANTLAFTSTATNGFSVDGTTFSVDAANHRVGLGLNTPASALDINGNMILRNSAVNGGTVNISLRTTGPAGLNRWGLGMGSAETGSGNTGGDFSIWNYADDGSYLSTPLFIKRSSGNVGIGNGYAITKLDTRANPGSSSPGEGAIGIGETTQSASMAGSGAIRYSTNGGGTIEYSNGTTWNTLTSVVKKSLVYGYLSTGQTITNGGGTFDVTEEFDQNNDFASNTFVVPRTGNYFFSVCGLAVNASWIAGEEFLIRIAKNGIPQVVGFWSAPGSGIYWAGACTSVTIQANAGDQITLIYYCNSSGKTIHGPSFNKFSIQEL